jgi:hypothetical protein
MSDLRKAAQSLVDRWGTPLWKDAPHTGQYIDALRAALAQPDPVAAEQDRCCRIVFGLCVSDNNAQEIVNAIRLG